MFFLPICEIDLNNVRRFSLSVFFSFARVDAPLEELQIYLLNEPYLTR